MNTHLEFEIGQRAFLNILGKKLYDTIRKIRNKRNIRFQMKQIDVSFSCVCPVTDHEFRHNIVKVAVDP